MSKAAAKKLAYELRYRCNPRRAREACELYVFRVPCASRRVASESECACECESTSPCVCVGGLGVSRSRRDPRPRALRPSASPATPWWRVDGAPARWGLGVGRGGRSPRRAAQPQGNKNNASNTAKTTDARGESSVKSRTWN